MSKICSNCYNGCVETTSDQCVKYTGVDVPVLGIQTGDSLSYVEQALITFLTSTLNGSGIILTINPQIICDIVNKNIAPCQDLSLSNIIDALIKAVCELDVRVAAIEDDLSALETLYTVGCLTDVTGSSGTHAILQAVITKLCGLEVELDALALDVDTNYVKLSEINSIIAAYLTTIGCCGGGGDSGDTKYYNRMVPYTVVEYYGSLTGKFDATGAGLGNWEKVYLCNGLNGTPDKRGRVPVGATTGMGGGAMSPAVDPAVSGNPNYVLLGTQGANAVTLTPSQIPSHSHSASAYVTDPGHTHTFAGATSPGGGGDATRDGVKTSLNTNSSTTGISVSVSIESTGGGLSHSNIQPGLGCYYIMYIP